jgi:hypothetical protein
VVVVVMAKGLSSALFIGRRGWFIEEKYLWHVVPVLYGCGMVSMEIAEGIRMARKRTRERGGNGRHEVAEVEDGGDA